MKSQRVFPQSDTSPSNEWPLLARGARGNAEGNTCEKNEGGGISVFDDGSAATLTRNTCRNNSGHGIAAADAGTDPVFRGNRCNNNGGWGINYFEDASPLIAPDNQAARNEAGQISPSP